MLQFAPSIGCHAIQIPCWYNTILSRMRQLTEPYRALQNYLHITTMYSDKIPVIVYAMCYDIA